MTGTMSSASSDWLQFYQHGNLPEQPPSTAARGWAGDVVASDATTAITSGSNITSATSPPSGRVSKPNNRRRPRASRRTPTTLVNTDTTNFRAMVQQFTGGGGGDGGQSAPPFISGNGSSNQYLNSYNNNSANLNFGLGRTSSIAAAAPPPTGGYNVQFWQTQGGDGGGQQYYHGNEQHQAFIQSLQNYSSSGPTKESSRDVGSTQGRASSSIETGEDNDYMF